MFVMADLRVAGVTCYQVRFVSKMKNLPEKMKNLPLENDDFGATRLPWIVASVVCTSTHALPPPHHSLISRQTSEALLLFSDVFTVPACLILIQETLPPPARRPFSVADFTRRANPLSFLSLFTKGPRLRALAILVSKNDEFCIKNEELCLKNDEFCRRWSGLCATAAPRGRSLLCITEAILQSDTKVLLLKYDDFCGRSGTSTGNQWWIGA